MLIVGGFFNRVKSLFVFICYWKREWWLKWEKWERERGEELKRNRFCVFIFSCKVSVIFFLDFFFFFLMNSWELCWRRRNNVNSMFITEKYDLFCYRRWNYYPSDYKLAVIVRTSRAWGVTTFVVMYKILMILLVTYANHIHVSWCIHTGGNYNQNEIEEFFTELDKPSKSKLLVVSRPNIWWTLILEFLMNIVLLTSPNRKYKEKKNTRAIFLQLSKSISLLLIVFFPILRKFLLITRKAICRRSRMNCESQLS